MPNPLDAPDANVLSVEERLAALEAEHAKALARIERLERLIAYTLSEVQQTALDPVPSWTRTLWDAMHNELAEIDRERDS